MAAVSISLTAATVPAFLVGALSTQMRDDLGGPGTAAVAITAFFVGAGASAVPMGRLADRVGARRALRIGVTISGLADLAIAGLGQAWWHVAVVLGVAGFAVGLVDTGGARSFAEAVPDERHGLAFGVKEASVPAASLLAGLSIPLLAQQLGWRTAFLVVVVFTPVVWLVVPPDRPSCAEDRDRAGAGSHGGPLVLFAMGVALGTAAATAAATLFVPAFVDRGWSQGTAGVLLAGASAASIGTRLVIGVLIDRRPTGSWYLTGVLMALGAVGAVTLTSPGSGAVGAAGSVLLVGAGWGWTGLAFQTAVRVSPGAPGTAAGLVLAGLSVGGAAGPAAFGAVASSASFGTAWAGAAGAFLLGAVAVVVSRSWSGRQVPAR